MRLKNVTKSVTNETLTSVTFQEQVTSSLYGCHLEFINGLGCCMLEA